MKGGYCIPTPFSVKKGTCGKQVRAICRRVPLPVSNRILITRWHDAQSPRRARICVGGYQCTCWGLKVPRRRGVLMKTPFYPQFGGISPRISTKEMADPHFVYFVTLRKSVEASLLYRRTNHGGSPCYIKLKRGAKTHRSRHGKAGECQDALRRAAQPMVPTWHSLCAQWLKPGAQPNIQTCPQLCA